MTQTPITPSIFDLSGLAALKNQAKSGDRAALKAAAQQFEAQFLQMVLKSMRDATPREGLFDSDQTRLYESLLDQQLSQVLAAKGSTGLAAIIERQLSRGSEASLPPDGGLPLQAPERSYSLQPAPHALPPPGASTDGPARPLTGTPAQPARSGEPVASPARQFMDRILPHVVEAGRSAGIPAEFMAAQAALETGWGRAEIRHADGRPSFNVFGIKAGRGWTGPTVEAPTTEYVDGVARTRVERFRAYASYAEGVADYARLLSSSRRYADAAAATDGYGFARALQRAGYATDPDYADKLRRILGSQTLRTAMAA